MQKFLLLKVYYNTAIILGQVKDLALQVLLLDYIFINQLQLFGFSYFFG